MVLNYKRIILLLFLVFANKTKACDCSNLDWANWSIEAVKSNIKSSDVIFIGELLTSTTENYSFIVKEVFKGDFIKNETFHGQYFDSCSGRPNHRRKGLWILYGYYYENYEGMTGYHISTCGLTRSLQFPIMDTPSKHCENWEEELCILNQTFNKDIELILSSKK